MPYAAGWNPVYGAVHGIFWRILGKSMRSWYNFFLAVHTVQDVYNAATWCDSAGCVVRGLILS